MSLQGSGQIAFSQIEAEYDDYSSPGFDLGSYYGLSRSLPTSGQISFADFYSENAYAGINVGAYDTGFGWWYGYDRVTTTMGTLTETFDYWFNGNTSPNLMYMLSCYWTQANTLYFHVSDNTSYYYLNTSSAFYRLFINGVSFFRTNAAYTDQGSYRRWLWSNVTSNPFGTSGLKQMALRMS